MREGDKEKISHLKFKSQQKKYPQSSLQKIISIKKIIIFISTNKTKMEYMTNVAKSIFFKNWKNINPTSHH